MRMSEHLREKLLVNSRHDLADLVERRLSFGPVRDVIFLVAIASGQQSSFRIHRIRQWHLVQHSHSMQFMGSGGGIVYGPFTFPRRIPGVCIDIAVLEIHRRSHTVPETDLDTPNVAVTMMLSVNKSRRDHMASSINCFLARDFIFCDGDNAPILDTDLSDYFGSIPHADLLKSVARRIIDRRVLHLIKQWLECSVEETDERGRKRRTTVAKDSRCGIPQGSPISPLQANLYMRRFVLAWEQYGLKQSLGSQIVNYADDYVILCKRGKAEVAELRMREIMTKLKLTVNEEKTQVCRIPEEEFDFLGYTFGRMYSARTGKARIGYRPSKQSIKRMVRKIHVLTAEAMTWQEITALVDKLNRTLRGWANYYQVGTVSRAYRAIDSYTTMRLRRWLRNKHKVRCSGYRYYSDSYLYETLGLVRLSRSGCDVSWVKA